MGDLTVLYRDEPPTVSKYFLHTRMAKYVHIHCKVYRHKDVPSNDVQELNQWLRSRWTEKDEIIDQMKEKRIKYRVLERMPWKAIKYYSIWTLIVLYLLFGILFDIGFLAFYLLLMSAMFPVLIVCIEHSQIVNLTEL